jgi:hypothetical protein
VGDRADDRHRARRHARRARRRGRSCVARPGDGARPGGLRRSNRSADDSDRCSCRTDAVSAMIVRATVARMRGGLERNRGLGRKGLRKRRNRSTNWVGHTPGRRSARGSPAAAGSRPRRGEAM